MSKYQLLAIDFILGVITSLVVGYVFATDFRTFVSAQNIDAAMFAGLVTFMALLATIRQNFSLSRQNRVDRNFAYRLAVRSKFEEMGMLVVARLLEIESRRVACISTIEGIRFCLDTGKIYKDSHNITSTEIFNSDGCKASAALNVYFAEQSKKWNEIISILNEMGSLASTIFLTYEANDNGKLTTQLLADINLHVTKINELNAKIGDKPEEIRDSIIDSINFHTLNLTKLHP